MKSFTNFIKALLTLTQTGIVMVLSKWIDLFGKAGLAPRDYQTITEWRVLAIFAVIILLIYVLLHEKSKIFIKKIFYVFSMIFILSLIGCFMCDHILGKMETENSVETTIQIWNWLYFALLSFMLLVVMTFTLYILKENEQG